MKRWLFQERLAQEQPTVSYPRRFSYDCLVLINLHHGSSLGPWKRVAETFNLILHHNSSRISKDTLQ